MNWLELLQVEVVEEGRGCSLGRFGRPLAEGRRLEVAGRRLVVGIGTLEVGKQVELEVVLVVDDSSPFLVVVLLDLLRELDSILVLGWPLWKIKVMLLLEVG